MGQGIGRHKAKAQESQSCCLRRQIPVHTGQGLVHFCVRRDVGLEGKVRRAREGEGKEAGDSQRETRARAGAVSRNLRLHFCSFLPPRITVI